MPQPLSSFYYQIQIIMTVITYTRNVSFNMQAKSPTLSSGICKSLRVSFGVINAVSNSSTENSTCIFKRCLKTCQAQKSEKGKKEVLGKAHLQKNSIFCKQTMLTCKKFSTDANSHMDRRLHRGSWDGSGCPTKGVTILLHCCCSERCDDEEDDVSLLSSSSCRSFFLFGFAFTFCSTANCCILAAARKVQARVGRLLLAVGVSFAVVGISFRAEEEETVSFWGWGLEGIEGEGDEIRSSDIVEEIECVRKKE